MVCAEEFDMMNIKNVHTGQVNFIFFEKNVRADLSGTWSAHVFTAHSNGSGATSNRIHGGALPIRHKQHGFP